VYSWLTESSQLDDEERHVRHDRSIRPRRPSRLQDAQQFLYREARALDDRDGLARHYTRPMPSSGLTVLGRQRSAPPGLHGTPNAKGVRGSVNLIARLSSGTPEVRPQLRLLQNFGQRDHGRRPMCDVVPNETPRHA